MKIVKYSMGLLLLAVAACTKSKTDYEAEIKTVVPEHYEYEEAISMSTGDYSISIDALNGTFYSGYNELHFKVTNIKTNALERPSEMTFLPIISHSTGADSSCPHQYNLKYDTSNSYFSGYSVFTRETMDSQTWKAYLSFKIGNQRYNVDKEINVAEQDNKNLNMASFRGNDGQDYCIALVSPQKPDVGENKLVAGIYKYDKHNQGTGPYPDPSNFSYSIVKGYTLEIDPRMPEPSMGNHSSPNNQNLIQQNDSLYHGMVNYTMTGNWTLNLIMLNQNGQIIKGSIVPTTFTPGVEGVKSDLHIDILF